MNNLSEREIKEIRILALKKREEIGYGPIGFIGENIFKVIREVGIQLVYAPILFEENRKNNFSGLYGAFRDHEDTHRFIGLNTHEYLDKQIFTLAHELYHHWEESQMKICRNIDDTNDIGENKANLFAAELLLPTSKLEEEVLKVTRNDVKLFDWEDKNLLRFVAQLHCDYGMPYKAICRSLLDNSVITIEQYNRLNDEDYRNPNGLYFQIGKNINEPVFSRLNTKTNLDGTDGDNLYDLIGLYESEIVSLAELTQDLELFCKSIEEFDLEEEISEESLAEWDKLLEEIEHE